MQSRPSRIIQVKVQPLFSMVVLFYIPSLFSHLVPRFEVVPEKSKSGNKMRLVSKARIVKLASKKVRVICAGN